VLNRNIRASSNKIQSYLLTEWFIIHLHVDKSKTILPTVRKHYCENGTLAVMGSCGYGSLVVLNYFLANS
jgi:hypothetical protein